MTTSQTAPFVVRITGSFVCSVEQLWMHLTEPEHIALWFPDHGQSIAHIDLVEPGPGSHFAVTTAARGPRPEILLTGNIVEIAAPTRFLLSAELIFARYSDVTFNPSSAGFNVQLRGSSRFSIEVRLSDGAGEAHVDFDVSCERQPFNHQFIEPWWTRRIDRLAANLSAFDATDRPSRD